VGELRVDGEEEGPDRAVDPGSGRAQRRDGSGASPANIGSGRASSPRGSGDSSRVPALTRPSEPLSAER
jgi:hypothetical protein